MNRVFGKISGRGILALAFAVGMISSAVAQTVTSVVLDPAQIVGAQNSIGIAYAGGTVNLSKPAGPNGAVVTLSSSNSVVSPPTSVTVKSGQKSASFRMGVLPVKLETLVTIKASLGTSSSSAVLKDLPPPSLTRFTIGNPTVNAWSSAVGILYVSWPALDFGVTVNLKSDNPAVKVPATVLVVGSDTSCTFTMSTTNVSAPTVATITASLGSKSFKAKLTVLPAVFTGNYVGSFSSTAGSIGPCSLVVTYNGKITGTSTDYSSGTGIGEKLTGTITPGGDVTITATSEDVNGPAPTTVTGTASINSNGNLVLSLSPATDASSVTTVTVNRKGKPLEYSGQYWGPVVTSNGGKGGASLIIEEPTFFCTVGIGTTTSNLTGKVSDTGIGGGGDFYVAFNAAGDLVFLAINLDGTTTSGVLTKTNTYPPQ